MTTLELIESAITSIEDGWTKSALETLKEAQLQEKAREQLLNAVLTEIKVLVNDLAVELEAQGKNPKHDVRVRRARAAIAKATGEQK